MAGRPKKTFTDKEISTIKAFARCHCPDTEIAAAMECEESTIKRHFAPLLKEQRELGKGNLRAMQYRKAMEGNIPMLIWVGKQILGQREKFEKTEEHSFLSKEDAINQLRAKADEIEAELKREKK